MNSKIEIRLRLCLALAIGLAMVGALFAPAQAQQGENNRPAPEPDVRYADRTDTTQPLREMPMRQPNWNDHVHRPRRMLPNRPGAPDTVSDPVTQTFIDPTVVQPATSFEGLWNVTGTLPADTNGDIGPNHYVQTVNVAFAIFDRAGNMIYGPAAINTLFAGFGGPCETTNHGDPIVLYDHLADRWLISQFSHPSYPNGPYYQCVAISQTGDPTGSYYRYQFETSRTKFTDYPKLGVWPDGYYMTANQFTGGSSWAGQGVAVLERDKMLAGQPARIIYFDMFRTDPNLSGMLPADLDGPLPPNGEPGYFAQIDNDAWGYSPDQLQIWQFRTDWAAPSKSTFSRVAALPTAPFDSEMCAGSRNCIPQPGGIALDPISDRLMYRLQYRNFGSYQTLVVNHTVDVNQNNKAGIRWYEVRKPGGGVWAINQQGTFSPDADHRWMGSVAMNGKGEIGLGYSVSSTATFPSIRFSGRLPGDLPGVLSIGEGTIAYGAGVQNSTSGRWGDYSMLAVDPQDDCTFWFTSQYYTTTTVNYWRTRIGKFQISTCAPSDTAPSVSITSPANNATVAGLATIQAAASDDQVVTQVAFSLDSTLLGIDTNGADGWSVSWDTTKAANGGHTLQAVATDNAGQTGSQAIQVTVSNLTGGVFVHIGDLDGASVISGKNRWDATVTILVEDSTHKPVGGVLVQGSWANAGSATCTTNAGGLCSLAQAGISTRTKSVTFNISGLTLAGYTYLSAGNHDPDGSSNGTSISINVPR